MVPYRRSRGSSSSAPDHAQAHALAHQAHMESHQAMHNPFEMMNSQMSQMMGQMDRLMGGAPGGMGMMGGMGGMGGGMSCGGGFSSMGGGMGGASSCSSYSCCSYSSSSSTNGGQPRVVQYSESSHGLRRPGEEAVTETQGKYHDSSGNQRINVSRTIGNRGRAVVAERQADGTERRTDNLVRPRRLHALRSARTRLVPSRSC